MRVRPPPEIKSLPEGGRYWVSGTFTVAQIPDLIKELEKLK
jgi:hypothetical protein